MIDLHTHSTASDGSFSPTSLMEEAAKRRISAIALTDHDTIEGLTEAAEAARALGIHFIPGIELEIEWEKEASVLDPVKKPGGEFHLLGLCLGRPSPKFEAAVEDLSRRREERNQLIVERMNKAGISVSYDEIKALAAGPEDEPKIPGSRLKRHTIGRPHFAAFLVKKRIVKNREQAFLRYMGRGKPFYIPKAGLEFGRAVEAIHDSGGIAVLAHPMSLYVAWGKLPDLVKNLKERGLDGLEAWHPSAKAGSCRRLEELAKKLALIVTAGSDFHGEARPDRKLGITAGGKKIDETYLEDLLSFVYSTK